MSGQQIGTVVGGVVGAVIGFYAGGNVYAGWQIGAGIGGLIGGAVDPTKMYGPHVGDGQSQSATDGAAISWVMGTAWVAGTIVDVGVRQEFPVKQSGGKGSGTEQYSYEAHQNFTIVVCESDELKGSSIDQVLMVEQDGKIVYDVRPGSTMLADSQKWLARNCIFYYGDEAQLPTAADEAAHGVGNAPAYRGVLRAFFTQFNVTAAGDRIPSFRFLVKSSSGSLQVRDFSIGNPTPSAITLNADGSVQNTSTNVGNGTYWKYPVPDSAYRLTADFVMLAAGGGDPLTIGLADAGGTHIMDFCARTEDKIDAAQRPAVNYFAADFWADSRFVTTGALAIGTAYRIILTLSGSTYSYTLLQGGNVVGSGSAPRMSANAPASLIIARTGNINAPAIEKITYAEVATQGAPSLDEVASNIVDRGGLAAADADYTGIGGQTVQGYTIAKQMNAVSALSPLLGAYFAYGSEYDGKIHFNTYGGDAVMTIDEDDLLEATDANDNAVTSDLRNNATEFPRRVIGQYYDPAQNYMPVTVMQTRRAAGVTATGDLSMGIPVVMDADTAQQTVDKALKVAYAQLEGKLEFCVPFAGPVNVYLSLVAGDPVIFRGKRWIVTNPILSAGYIKLTLQYDRQSAYTSNVQAIPGLTPTPPASRYSGPTTLIPMNLPALQTGDTYGLYLAAGPVDPTTQNWRGCNVQMSLDSGATWQTVTQINAPSTYGTVVSDTGTELDVQVDGDLESVGSAQLDARQNGAALTQGTATEVLQFGTATEDPSTAHLYALTDVRRAQLGTTQISGAAGDTFVMLDSVVLLPIDLAFAGKTLYFRAVGFGENADDQPIVSLVYSPDTTVIHDGGTVT